MTRGRKKDLTIPPTRSLVQQRDYRARKAHYVAELEERCKRAEEENKRLRQELETAHANMSVPFLYNPVVAAMSAELLHNLSAASNSLEKFQDFARNNPPKANGNSHASSPSLNGVRLPPLDSLHCAPRLPLPPILSQHVPSFPPLRTPNNRERPLPDRDVGIGHHPYSPRRRYSPEASPPSSSEGTEPASHHHPRRHRSSSSDSDCCGGYFDCDSFCQGRTEGIHQPTCSSHQRPQSQASYSPRS